MNRIITSRIHRLKENQKSFRKTYNQELFKIYRKIIRTFPKVYYYDYWSVGTSIGNTSQIVTSKLFYDKQEARESLLLAKNKYPDSRTDFELKTATPTMNILKTFYGEALR